MTFKILKTDPSRSLFSPQADVVIQLQYGPGIVVEAHGLYFRYVDQSPYFEAVLDKDRMQVSTNLATLAQARLTSAANELLAKIEGPVQVSDFEFTDFAAGKAGMKCKIAVNLGELLPLSATGTAILTTDQKLQWSGELGMTYKCQPPIPIGSTPLGIHEIKGSWNPDAKKSPDGKARQLKIGALISTVASETDKVVALDVSMAFDFPIRAVDLEGTVTFGGTPLGDIWGTIDLDRELAEAQFKIPGRRSAIPPNVFSMDGRTTITREGLESVGNCQLFGKAIDRSRLFLATNGHGSLSVDSDKICGVDLAPRLNAGFQPGFSEVWAKMVFETRVNVGFARLLDVAVEVQASSRDNPEPVYVVANAWGRKIGFHLPSLEALDETALANAVKEQLPDLYDAALDAMARGEADARGALAKAEKDFKAEVSQAVAQGGFDALRTGNPELDTALGKMSEAGKQAGGELAAQREQLGKTLTELRKNPSGSVEGLVTNLKDQATSVLTNPGSLLNPLGGGRPNREDSGPSRETLELQVRQAKVELSLQRLRDRLNQVALRQTLAGDHQVSGRDKLARSSAARIDFRNAASELQGKQDAVLALLVCGSDFRSTLNTRGTSQVAATSDAQAATVRLRNLVVDQGQARPRATIQVPPLRHVSDADMQLLARREIQRLVELHVPNVTVEGPRMYYESRLQIANRCSESITVWVQGRSRSVRNEAFVWRWAPGEPGSDTAYRFRIPPGRTELLEIRPPDPAADVAADAEARSLSASRVRLWVESESGERWLSHRDRDLWLVELETRRGETRGYFADEPRTYTHVVEPQAGSRVYGERVLQLTNRTSEPLQVQLQYLAADRGQLAWQQVKPFTIPAGKSGYPTNAEGFKIRAAEVRFTARSEHFYFGRHARVSLSLVDEAASQRLYRADRIGTYEYVFETPAAAAAGESK